MTFSDDPYQGMQTQSFGGAAVTFLPTVPVATQRQASCAKSFASRDRLWGIAGPRAPACRYAATTQFQSSIPSACM